MKTLVSLAASSGVGLAIPATAHMENVPTSVDVLFIPASTNDVLGILGRNYAEALVLQSECDPTPPIRAGRLQDASETVREMMETMFPPLQDKFRAADAS